MKIILELLGIVLGVYYGADNLWLMGGGVSIPATYVFGPLGGLLGNTFYYILDPNIERDQTVLTHIFGLSGAILGVFIGNSSVLFGPNMNDPIPLGWLLGIIGGIIFSELGTKHIEVDKNKIENSKP